MKYNTQEKPLRMREYGRNIQKMVEYCEQIEDREERTRCANAIAGIMTRLFPELNGEDHENRKVWDHIHLISGYKLDIDYPVEVHGEEDQKKTPFKIPYPSKSDHYRNYGSNMIKMIREIAKMEGSVEKDKLIFLVANQMKKLLINANPDTATDRRVFKDIKDISGGHIDIDPENYRLNEYIGISVNQLPQKKKKKK